MSLSLAKNYRAFGLVWMNRQVMAILMSISRFCIHVCDNLTVFNTNFKVKKYIAFFAWLICKFNVSIELIKTTQKSLNFLLTMCPHKENTINTSKPNQRLWFLGFKKSSFNFIHKQTRIKWGKLGTNSGTRNLLLNLSVKFEVAILQDKISHPYQEIY